MSNSTPNGGHVQSHDSPYNNNNHHHSNSRHLRESSADFRRHYSHNNNNNEPQSQLEAALQRGLNQMSQNCNNQQSSPNAIMKNMIHLEQIIKSCNGNGVYDCNGTLDLKMDKHRQQQDDQVPSITITRVNVCENFQIVFSV